LEFNVNAVISTPAGFLCCLLHLAVFSGERKMMYLVLVSILGFGCIDGEVRFIIIITVLHCKESYFCVSHVQQHL